MKSEDYCRRELRAAVQDWREAVLHGREEIAQLQQCRVAHWGSALVSCWKSGEHSRVLDTVIGRIYEEVAS